MNLTASTPAMKMACLLVTLITVGCDSVTIDKPVGEEFDAVQAKRFLGRWESSDHNLLELRWHSDGYLVGGSMSWDDKTQKFSVRNEKFTMRTLDDAVFAFTATEGRTSFARIEFLGNNQIQIYPPDPDKFRSALEDGLLSGSVQEKNNHFNVFLDSSSEETIAFLKSEKWKQYFLDDPKMVIKRRKSPSSDRSGKR